MIRPIDIRLNAAHPELPLCEAVTYTGAPSTVLIRGVPPNCGRWAITAVFVAASFPDGSTTTRAAVQSANGVWVATLPATATSGRTANGLRIMADGVDENGDAVTGYILGVADFAVASLAVTPAPEPGETSYQMLYFDEVPSVLRKGDVTKIDGVLKFYNGSAWEPFAAAADVPTPSSTAPVMDGTATPGVSNDYARGDHVHPTDTSRVPTSRTVNGKELTGNVALTGADIPVSDMDSTKIDAALAGKADCVSNPTDGHLAALDEYGNLTDSGKAPNDFALIGDIAPDWMDTTEIGTVFVADQLCSFSGRTYRCILGYTFSGEDTPPADTTHWALATVEDVLAALRIAIAGKADASALTAHTSDTTIHVTAADKAAWNGKADASAIPYSLGTPIIIDTASSETVEGETVYYGEATLANRTANIVRVTAATALDELRITFPAATSGKVRDFGLRVEIGTGSAALAAPALVPIAPTGETIKLENNAKEIPALADGTATAKGVTLLYFSENAPGVFVVKGEQVEEVA